MPTEPHPVTPPPGPASQARIVAAADLGSNSFHLVIARETGAGIQVIDRLRERVRLAAGLDDDKRLDPAYAERALQTLARFGDRLRDLPADRKRVVATDTFRRIRDGRAFFEACEAAIGAPIEIVSGAEEARLVYLGVAHAVPAEPVRRLVVDIGGGSTELIVGSGAEPIEATSRYMGCVSFSRRFFGDGKLSRKRFDQARLAARLELRSVESSLRAHGWDACYGSSGTVHAIKHIARAHGWSDGEISGRALRKLRKAMVRAGRTDKLGGIEGLRPDRVEVLAGGLAILLACFDALGIETMRPAPAALREGVLYDLLGRFRQEDVRERTIAAMQRRYEVDRLQAARVERMATRIFDRVGADWGLGPTDRRWLGWAARLHEVGIAISHTGYHKHGGYILTHAAMPGFSRDTQHALAALLRNHRRKISVDALDRVADTRRGALVRLTALLRVAVLLERTRSGRLPRGLDAEAIEGSDGSPAMVLRFDPDWFADHPLVAADLRAEASRLSSLGVGLRIEPPDVACQKGGARGRLAR